MNDCNCCEDYNCSCLCHDEEKQSGEKLTDEKIKDLAKEALAYKPDLTFDEIFSLRLIEKRLRWAYEKGIEDSATVAIDYCIDTGCYEKHPNEGLLKDHLLGITAAIMRMRGTDEKI